MDVGDHEFNRHLSELLSRVAGGEVIRITDRRGPRFVTLYGARALEIPALTFCTFDLRMAQAARRLGFTVLGA